MENMDLEFLDVVPGAAWTSLGLVGGFATARYSGSRALGGVVLAVCGGLAGRKWLRHGPAVAGGLGAAYLAAFGGSHPLAKKIGAWPSVFGVTAATAAASWMLADRH